MARKSKKVEQVVGELVAKSTDDIAEASSKVVGAKLSQQEVLANIQKEGGSIYERAYRGEDGKLRLKPQDYSRDASTVPAKSLKKPGDGAGGHKKTDRVSKEQYEARIAEEQSQITKQQAEIEKERQKRLSPQAVEERRKQYDDMMSGKSKELGRKTLGDRGQQALSFVMGTGDETSRFGGRKTRKENMILANNKIDTANINFIRTGEGELQRPYDKKSYYAEVTGNGKTTPEVSDSKLGQKGMTAPNSTNPADVAEETATGSFIDLKGISDWAEKNQLVVAGALIGTAVLLDD